MQKWREGEKENEGAYNFVIFVLLCIKLKKNKKTTF